MNSSDTLAFDFTYGWCFENWAEFKIYRERGKNLAALSERKNGARTKRCFEISESGTQAIYDQLHGAGGEKWFCYYEPIRYIVMDGFSWHMKFDGVVYNGNNVIPKGFAKFSNYLAERFNCLSFIVGEDVIECEVNLKEDFDPRMHIAGYSRKVCDPDEYDDELQNNFFTKQQIEEGYKSVSRQLRHDLDVLASQNPEIANYRDALTERNISPAMDSLLRLDAESLDAETILAMLLFVSRHDRLVEPESEFLQCIKNGTFKKWLSRYAELVEYPYR